MRLLLLAILTIIPQVGQGATISRLFQAEISDGLVINSDAIEAELDQLVDTVNNIDTDNVTDGTLKSIDFEASATVFVTNRKSGCKTKRTSTAQGAKSVVFSPPCEITIDNLRGEITATKTISLIDDLEDGVLSSQQFFYMYSRLNGTDLDFVFSATAPDNLTVRKVGDPTARYMGTVRTEDASSDIINFQHSGKSFFWNELEADMPTAGLIATFTIGGFGSGFNITYTVPAFFEKLHFQWTAYVSAFPAQCQITVYNVWRKHQAIVIATGGNSGIIAPAVPVFDSVVFGQQGDDIDNCIEYDLRVVGWEDPDFFHD